MKVDPGTRPSISTVRETPPNWWWFCFFILSLKLFLLALDPLPKLFMGDSGSYIWTALTGWIPPDRSFLYGYVIRWVAVFSGSLSPLLLLQTFLGAMIAVTVAITCRRFFGLSLSLSYLFGLLCALDPLQLVWERYVMAETVSLFLYAALLICSFFYLRQRQMWQLILLQLIGVLLISFRISYLLVVEASTLLWPILAFAPRFRQFRRSDLSASPLLSAALHLGLSLVFFFGFHYTYKRINGYLADRPPAYLYSSGFSILAAWAPTLRAEDSPDARLADIIQHGAEIDLTDPGHRNNQLYYRGFLTDRWRTAEPNVAIADRVAKQTALHSLTHRPLGVVELGLKTFVSYFYLKSIYQQAKSDLGNADWPTPMTRTMAARFRLSAPEASAAAHFTLLQRYFLRSHPYWYLVIFSPLICALLFLFLGETYIFILFAHASIFLATDCFLVVTASVRYLQPLSLITILAAALVAKLVAVRRPAPVVK